MKWTKIIGVTLSALGLVVLFGCAAIMNVATPCFIEEEAAIYADEETTSFLPFTTLWDAKRIDLRMDYRHQINQIGLARALENDTMQYGFLKGVQTPHIMAAQEFQQAIFTPEGPLGLLLPTLAGGTLGALLIRRPGDTKKE